MIEKQLAYIELGLQAWALWCFNKGPRLVLAISLFALFALAYALTHLQVNSDAKNLINPELPYRVAEDTYNRAFPDQEETLLVVVTADTETDADNASKVLTEALKESPVIKSIFAPTVHPFFEKNGLLYQDTNSLDQTLANLNQTAPLIRELGKDPSLSQLFASLSKAEENIENSGIPRGNIDRFYGEIAHVMHAVREGRDAKLDWQRILDGRNKDETERFRGRVKRLITITPKFDFDTLNPAKQVFETVQRSVQEIKDRGEFDNLEIGITGTQALRSEELQSVTKGITFALITSLIMVAGLLLTALRSPRMTGVAVLILLMSVSFSLAFAAAVLEPLNLVSVAFVVLLIGLGIDFVIHLTMDILDRMSDGKERAEALRLALHDIGPALFLAVVTTVLAFLSFVPTDFQGMAQLGIISSAGVIIAFIVTITIVPAALPLLPQPKKRLVGKSIISLPSLPLRSIRWLVCLGTVAAIPFSAQIYFDSNPMSMRDPTSPSVVTYLGLSDNPDTTPYRVNALVENHEEALGIVELAEAHPLIERVITLARFVPEDQDEKLELIDFASEQLLNDLENNRNVSSEINLEANVAKLMEAIKAYPSGTPAGRLHEELAVMNESHLAAYHTAILDDWVTIVERLTKRLTPDFVQLDTLPDALSDRYVSHNGKIRIEFVPAKDAANTEDRKAFVAATREFVPAVSGPPQIYIESAKVISRSMLEAGALAVILVTILLGFVVRKASLIIIVLLPLGMAAILTGAVAFLIDQPLNFSNVIALPLLIGLGVDSGIHLAVRRRKQNAENGAIYKTSTPKAVAYSAMTTIVAFGSLATSAHRGTASMGIMLALSIACILITTITLIPGWSDYLHARKHKVTKK